MKTMKKIPFVLIIIALGLILSSTAAFGDEKAINAITIDVELLDDGSAIITEIWDIDNVYSGTEYYITAKNLGPIDIHSLQVWDESGALFETLDSWNSSRSFEQKAYQCGLLKVTGGYEICWGISSYGDHVYTIKYVMTNFVKEYTDAAGFNYEFVTYDLSSNPQYVSVSVHKDNVDINDANAGIWGFGFDGDIYFTDGGVFAESTKAFTNSSYATIMCRFDKSLFGGLYQASGSFDTVVDRAFENSDYKNNYTLFGILGMILLQPFVIMILIMIGVRASKGRNPGSGRKSTFGSIRLKLSDGAKVVVPNSRNIGYSRKIPFEGNLLAAHNILSFAGALPSGNNILGCYLLRWHKKGYIRLTEHENISKILKRTTFESVVEFRTASINEPLVEKQLYSIFYQASGPDNVLKEKELEKWSRKNYTRILNWEKMFDKEGEKLLIALGSKDVMPTGIFSTMRPLLSPKGHQELVETLGFKKYLQDFTIINERRAVEVELWDEYLVFAMLFGIAEQVAKDFSDIYPTYFTAGDYYSGSSYRVILAANHLSHSSHRGVLAATSASSGGGGSTSSGGGGGSSGGGGGGGSR